jgi:hypothetical protein
VGDDTAHYPALLALKQSRARDGGMEEYLHLQPPELTEKEAMRLAMVTFKLDEMRK